MTPYTWFVVEHLRKYPLTTLGSLPIRPIAVLPFATLLEELAEAQTFTVEAQPDDAVSEVIRENLGRIGRTKIGELDQIARDLMSLRLTRIIQVYKQQKRPHLPA